MAAGVSSIALGGAIPIRASCERVKRKSRFIRSVAPPPPFTWLISWNVTPCAHCRLSHAARLLVLVFAVLFGAAGAEETPASIDQFNQRLDRARATLDEIGKALAQPALTDGALRLLRDRIDPLPHELQDTIDKLTPRLQGIEARLKELGAPPAAAVKPPAQAPTQTAPGSSPDKAPTQKPPSPPTKAPGAKPAAPPPASGTDANSAAASVNAEWAEQRKLFDEVDATLKRARSLLLESQQTTVAIVARQRSLFAKTLFLRTNGLFSPALWREAAREAPNVARDSSEFLRDRTAIFASRLANGPRAGFIAVVLLIFLSIPPAVYLARRVQARRVADTAPSPLQKAAGAAWLALVAAAGSDRRCRRPGPDARRLRSRRRGARSGFAPDIRGRRAGGAVPTPSRARCSPPPFRNGVCSIPATPWPASSSRLALSVAIVLSVERLFEQFEETVQASLAVVVATRGLGALAVAGLLAGAAAGSMRRGAAEGGAALAGWRRDWVNLGRVLALAPSP